MTSKSKKKQKSNRPAEIHTPYELQAMMTPEDISWVKKRLRRKQGTCAVCKRPLGKDKPLALTFAPTQIDDMVTMAGEWNVSATHRWCQKEAIRDSATEPPQRTYMTTLMALPVEQTTDAPAQVPALLINPTIDHMQLRRDADGTWHDALEYNLENSVGFGRMTKTDAKSPDETGLTAYVHDADVTVALNDNGLSWTHEQPESNADTITALTESLNTLIKGWDDTLLVMISPKFKSWDPQQIFTDLPDLLRNGEVLAATANVEFRESTAAKVQKALTAASE